MTLKPTKMSKYKARLVVQGCLGRSAYIWGHAPAGSVGALMVTLGFVSQDGWAGCPCDAKSAYLQAEGVNRPLPIRMPGGHPSDPGEVFCAQGSIYGAKDAGRAWYNHLHAYLEKKGNYESRLERGVSRCVSGGEFRLVPCSHVDDFLLARKTVCPVVGDVLGDLPKFLHLEKRDAACEYCGVQFGIGSDTIVLASRP